MTNNQHTQQITDLLTDWVRAVRAKDVSAITKIYHNDIIAFDAIGQLQFSSLADYSAHWQRCMTFCSGEFFYEMHQLKVKANQQLAFAHCLTYCGGTNDKGELQKCWMRTTQCWQQGAEGWKVVHEHFSMPFDMQSGAILTDLMP